MAIDQGLLDQALGTPESRGVLNSPLVTAVILPDATNAQSLVPALEQYDSLRARNAQRILCQFEPAAVPHLVAGLSAAGLEARKAGIEVLWAILTGEPESQIRETVTAVAPQLSELLDDRRPLPDHLPPYIERDFRGRLCDSLFIVLQLLFDPEYDQTVFRSMDEAERDQDITVLKRRRLSLPNA